jgi:pyruvate/2-oxoglutarate dehydrogenase complex dihydrolipoamide dehydrogenase (E3) component
LNPTVGREKQWGIGTLTKAERRKHVLVVGAGPAGCEASIVAAKRGHDVTLIERNNRVGGQVRLASLLPGREEFGLAIDYWEGQLQKLNVEVLLNKEATESDILNGPYDSVVIATGSTADRSGFSPIFSVESRIQGLEGNEIVCTVDEIVSGVKKAGYNVVIYDDQGDIKGVSVAEMLLNEDREVEVVSRLDMLGQFVDVMTRVAAQIRVFRKNVKFTPDNIIKRINERELTLMNIYSGIESKRTEVDTLVLITWRHANKSLYDSLRGKFNGGLYCIGDAVSPRTVEEAVYEGHKVGREI